MCTSASVPPKCRRLAMKNPRVEIKAAGGLWGGGEVSNLWEKESIWRVIMALKSTTQLAGVNLGRDVKKRGHRVLGWYLHFRSPQLLSNNAESPNKNPISRRGPQLAAAGSPRGAAHKILSIREPSSGGAQPPPQL
ncbi:hypothetical protein NDU88_005024 [Pleurodeles waltl]|uniref:Uncharacterized protein n=1 Tax=Pleurodeles waltl TaxID=8319 RepID=A0AAV7TBB3_PLEWA|nr:hypothetical protein NDU88_005024 [Pleurodeles waltl]